MKHVDLGRTSIGMKGSLDKVQDNSYFVAFFKMPILDILLQKNNNLVERENGLKTRNFLHPSFANYFLPLEISA